MLTLAFTRKCASDPLRTLALQFVAKNNPTLCNPWLVVAPWINANSQAFAVPSNRPPLYYSPARLGSNVFTPGSAACVRGADPVLG